MRTCARSPWSTDRTLSRAALPVIKQSAYATVVAPIGVEQQSPRGEKASPIAAVAKVADLLADLRFAQDQQAGRRCRDVSRSSENLGRNPPPVDRSFSVGGLSSVSGRLGFVCSTVSRNGAARRNSPATTATTRVWRPRRSLVDWDAHNQPSRAISTIRQAIRHARSRRATGECVAAAGRPPRRGTARATPTRIADAAIPGRSRRNGPGNGFAKRCAHGDRATALRRPRMTGRARTRAGAAANRSNDYRPENGPRRPPSSICTAAGRAPSRTPSAAPERLGVHAADIRTRARAPARDRERRRSPRNASVPVASLRRGAERATGRLSAAADCGEGTIRGSPGGHGHAVDATAATVGRLSEYRCCLPGLRHFRDGSRFRWV